MAYAAVFALEALLFVVSARLAGGIERPVSVGGRAGGTAHAGAAATASP